MKYNSVDIFCHCIDNFGDAGVTYRFAKEFKIARPDCRVRVFIDNMGTLSAIAGGIDPLLSIQEYGGITYINTSGVDIDVGVADVMVEMFACHIPEKLMELAYDESKLIINIEYLSAEDWVEEYHLKESLLGRGTVRKFYFMPGFREGTGGLIINSSLKNPIPDSNDNDRLIGTVFTYERGFDNLIADVNALGRDVTLLLFGEKSQRGMAASLSRVNANPDVHIVNMPFVSQHDYDALLCRADFNIVRGEDSLARAVLSGKPFIWNAYIQDAKYQLVKVRALLETMRPYYERRGGDYDALFTAYGGLMLAFNDADAETSDQVTFERYEIFFKNLKKYTHIARAINYFMESNCDLIKKFCDFLDNYSVNIHK